MVACWVLAFRSTWLFVLLTELRSETVKEIKLQRKIIIIKKDEQDHSPHLKEQAEKKGQEKRSCSRAVFNRHQTGVAIERTFKISKKL